MDNKKVKDEKKGVVFNYTPKDIADAYEVLYLKKLKERNGIG